MTVAPAPPLPSTFSTGDVGSNPRSPDFCVGEAGTGILLRRSRPLLLNGACPPLRNVLVCVAREGRGVPLGDRPPSTPLPAQEVLGDGCQKRQRSALGGRAGCVLSVRTYPFRKRREQVPPTCVPLRSVPGTRTEETLPPGKRLARAALSIATHGFPTMKATAANAALDSAYRIFRFGKSFLYLIQLHFFFASHSPLFVSISIKSVRHPCLPQVCVCVCLFVCLFC